MTVPDVATRRVQDYLSDLDDALAHLPRQRRHEIVQEVRAHISAALVDAGDASPASVDNVLERLGPPSDIAAAADEYPAPNRHTLGTRDLVTVLLLLVGGVLVPVIGWFIGLVLLWTSTTWQRRDKVIGTALLPGGLLGAVLVGLLPTSSGTVGCAGPAVPAGHLARSIAMHCTTAASGPLPTSVLITLIAVMAVVPLGTTCWLTRQARRSS